MIFPRLRLGKIMSEEELAVQSGNAPTMYFDGFGYFRKINGVLRCVGFVLGGGVQLNLIVSLAGADLASSETKRVLADPPVRGVGMWAGTALAH